MNYVNERETLTIALQTELKKYEKEKQLVIKLENEVKELSLKLETKETNINYLETELQKNIEAKNNLEEEKREYIKKITNLENKLTDNIQKDMEEIKQLKEDKIDLQQLIEANNISKFPNYILYIKLIQ